MKIIIEQDKTVFGKKKPYIASFGSFQEKGSTKEEAKQKLLDALEWYFSNGLHDNIITAQIPSAGITLILKRDFYGYEISKHMHDETDKSCICICSYGRMGRSKAIEELKKYAENYLAQ